MSDQLVDVPPGLRALRRGTWVTVVGTTTFFLANVGGGWVATTRVPVAARLVGGAALVVVVTAAGALVARRLSTAGAPVAPGPPALPAGWLGAGAGAATVLGVLMLADGQYVRWAYAPVTITVIAAALLPGGRRWLLLAGAAVGGSVVAGLVAWVTGDGLHEAVTHPPEITAVVAGATLGMLWSWDAADRLHTTRQRATEAAVHEERLRFAADLHDIQGHHLQVIALKAELATRLAERDPARAAAEMDQVRCLAIDALHDSRAVVQGYRRTTLEEEIANVTRVLAAADIDTTMTVSDGATSPHLLGLVVREATTNVLRHSRAQHAEVDYRVVDGIARLRMGNDGAPTDGSTRTTPSPDPGTGLASLAERLAAAGGQLTWSHRGDRFEVLASLPVDHDIEPRR